MQKPSERHKLTSDNNIIKVKNPVHDPFKLCYIANILVLMCTQFGWEHKICGNEYN